MLLEKKKRRNSHPQDLIYLTIKPKPTSLTTKARVLRSHLSTTYRKENPNKNMKTPRVTNTNYQAAPRAPLKSTRILEETLARPEIKKTVQRSKQYWNKVSQNLRDIAFLRPIPSRQSKLITKQLEETKHSKISKINH